MDTIDLNKIDELIEEFWGQTKNFSGPQKDRINCCNVVNFIIAKNSVDKTHRIYNLIRDYIENKSTTFAVDKDAYIYRRNPIVKKQVDPPCTICGDIYAMPCAKHNNEYRCFQHS